MVEKRTLRVITHLRQEFKIVGLFKSIDFSVAFQIKGLHLIVFCLFFSFVQA